MKRFLRRGLSLLLTLTSISSLGVARANPIKLLQAADAASETRALIELLSASSGALTATELSLVAKQLGSLPALANYGGMGMSLVPVQSLRLEQRLALKQTLLLELRQQLIMTLKLSLDLRDPAKDFLAGISELVETGVLVRQSLKLYAEGPDVEFYVFHRKSIKDETSLAVLGLETLARSSGGGFAFPGVPIAVVDGDRWPKQFLPFVAVHEWMEVVYCNHEKASIVEFVYAAKHRKLSAYLEWLRQSHADKFANVLTLQHPFEEALESISQELAVEVSKAHRTLQGDKRDFRADPLRAIQRQVEYKFLDLTGTDIESWRAAWPMSLLERVKAVEVATETASTLLGQFFIRVEATFEGLTPGESLVQMKEALEAEFRTMLSSNREAFSSADPHFLERFWIERRTIAERIFNVRRNSAQMVLPVRDYNEWLLEANGKSPIEIGLFKDRFPTLLANLLAETAPLLPKN